MSATRSSGPPTYRTTVAPAQGGNYQEVVTEGVELFGNCETRAWRDLPDDARRAWIEYIESTHDAQVGAVERLGVDEYALYQEVWVAEGCSVEWEDEPNTMQALITAIDGLQVAVTIGPSLREFQRAIRRIEWVGSVAVSDDARVEIEIEVPIERDEFPMVQQMEQANLDVREVPRVLKAGLAKKKLKSRGRKRATTYHSR